MISIFSIYEFNQYFNDLWIRFPISWNMNKLSWSFYNPVCRESIFTNFYFLALTFKLVFFVLVLMTSIFANKCPSLFEFYHLVTQWIIVFIEIVILAADYLVYHDGKIVTFSCNWAHTVEPTRKITANDQKIASIMVLNLVVCLTLSTYSVAYTMVYFNIDPIYTIVKCILYYNSEQLQHWFIFKVLRLIVIVYTSHVVCTCPRTFMAVALSQGLHRLFLLKTLKRSCLPTQRSIRFYKEYYIVLSILKPFDYKMTTIILSSTFIYFIVFSNVIMLTLKKKA